MTASPAAMHLLVVLLAAPLLEEIVFRHGLQQALHGRFGRSVAASGGAIAVTAIAFAATHVALNPSPWALWTLLPALAIGGVYHHTRRVLPCVALHAAFNAAWWLCAPSLVLT